MRRLRVALSRLSMLVGAVLMVVGIGVRVGIVPLPVHGSGLPEASPGASAVARIASAGASAVAPGGAKPAAAIPTGGTSGEPGPSASTEPSPSPDPATQPPPPRTPDPGPTADPRAAGTVWFADDFDAVAAWPDGRLDWLTSSIRDGAYRINATATDLPVFVFAAAGEGAPAMPVAVAAELAIGPGDPASAAGIALESADGTRLLAVVSGDGRVAILFDSIEQLDSLASGSIDPPMDPVRLRLVLDGETVLVTVDDVLVARARLPFAPVGFGLAVWARGDARFDVLRYEVRSEATP